MHWLVVRGGALGDFVVAEPAIAAVREMAARLTLVANPQVARLWPELADQVIDVRGTDSLWLFGNLDPPFVPDAALCFTPGVAERLTALGVPLVLTAAATPTTQAHLHFFQPVRASGLEPRAPRVRPDPALVARIAARLPSRAPVVLAPGAGGETKRWPRMIEVAAILRREEVPFVFLVGPDEHGMSLPEPCFRDLSLGEVVALASSSGAWVGCDSGTTHLASAAGATTLAVFGPTRPDIWAPPGASVVHVDVEPAHVAHWIRLHRGQPHAEQPDIGVRRQGEHAV